MGRAGEADPSGDERRRHNQHGAHHPQALVRALARVSAVGRGSLACMRAGANPAPWDVEAKGYEWKVGFAACPRCVASPPGLVPWLPPPPSTRSGTRRCVSMRLLSPHNLHTRSPPLDGSCLLEGGAARQQSRTHTHRRAGPDAVSSRLISTAPHDRDHAGGNVKMAELLPGVSVVGGAKEAVDGCTRTVQHGDTVTLGSTSIQCLDTPLYVRAPFTPCRRVRRRRRRDSSPPRLLASST